MDSGFGDHDSRVYPGTLRGYRSWFMRADGMFGTGVGWSYRWQVDSTARCLYTRGENLVRVEIPGERVFLSEQIPQSEIDCYYTRGIISPYTHGTPPDPVCRCGFYAYYGHMEKEYKQSRNIWNALPVLPPSSGGLVYGIIEAYGKIILGTKGFRAEKARIVALVKPTDTMNIDLENCFTEGSVEIFHSYRDLLDTYPPQGPPA